MSRPLRCATAIKFVKTCASRCRNLRVARGELQRGAHSFAWRSYSAPSSYGATLALLAPVEQEEIGGIMNDETLVACYNSR